MKIAVNTRLLLKGRLDGIGWFIYEHFSRITKNHPEHEFHFFFDRPYDPEFVFSKNVVPHVVHPQARHPILYKIWFDFMLPREIRKCGADLFVSPDMIASLKLDIPQLLVVHDLNFEHYPQDLKRSTGDFWRKRTRAGVQKASRIVAVSDFTKNDLIQTYGVGSHLVDVVYNAAGYAYKPIGELAQANTRSQYAGGKPYFLFVSSIHPRKNLHRVLQAYDLFREKAGVEFRLIVVGKKFWDYPEMGAAFDSMKFKNEVIFTGRLEQEDLAALTAAATASLYVSYYEGFGIPIIEAMKSGTPVVYAHATALPEVAGDAGVGVDPFSVDEIAGAMQKLATNVDFRQDQIAKGLTRAEFFNWDNSAEQLWTCMEKLLS
jgi:glycosyltransferase involved in cell wall biosynthesis